jgi:dTDP-4-amino-4,6-dideoxygalactose transaminase
MIPVMRPRLPSAARLGPYLRRIDAAQIYSNFGPLALALEDRFAAHFGVAGKTVVTVANATLGLALALMAQRPARGALCLVPGWTFVASAHAAVLAGLVPYFVDVDPESWTLDPATAAAAMRDAPDEVGAVMPVMPFGGPVDVAAWDRFRARSGVAVVIDAAAGFDTLRAGDVPAVVSLHATKALGAGEGGFVVARDPALIAEIRARANFGFAGSREAIAAAMNAKLSEYHAAVAHAALDEWGEARTEWLGAAAAYRAGLAGAARLRLQPGFGETWVASTCVIGLAEAAADRVEAALATRGIGTRRWWGDGAHRHPATRDYPRAALPATARLARASIAVPLYRDIAAAEVARVCAALHEATADELVAAALDRY